VRLSDSRAEGRFRASLGEWLDENQPAADRASDPPRSSGHIPRWAADWQRCLFDAGWLVPRWPAELGGREAGPIEQMIYLEEMSRRRVPRTVNPQGLDACAPTLADHGAGRQRDEWLPATLHGEMSWCVAVYGAAGADDGGAAPEPAAGGAAAPLTLAAERDGALVLTGAVPAPPGAADADRCLCAVSWRRPRSRDGDADLAVVAVDLTAAGVERPAAAGAEPGGDDARLAFAGVAVSTDDVIGGREQGWPVLQSLRARLRSVRWITSLLSVQRALDALVDVGRARGLADDAVFRDTLAGLQVEADAVRALAYRALAKQGTGRPNPELAMLPLATAEAERRLYLVGLETLGADGLDLGLDGPMGWPSGSWASEWLAAARDTTEAGGTAGERDRVAGRVLGFPLR
jgi:alkylation response protein AidB-like acyl-CoA dehydrogenase